MITIPDITSLNAIHPHVTVMMHSVGRGIILRHFQQLSADQIHEKAPDDLVTIADRESEVALTKALTEILPDASIVGEEAVAADPGIARLLGDDLVWIIDPIDGTSNFASGNPPFAILIALASKGTTIAGWIHDPLTGRTCHSFAGHGAYINGERVVAQPTGEAQPVAAISTLFVAPEKREALIALGQTRYRLVDIPRCAAEQYPRLVIGQNDITLYERTLAWDHAAGALFLNEAGGKCARFDGSPYRVDEDRKGMLAAASPALWDEAAAIFSTF